MNKVYEETNVLRQIITRLKGRKFMLDYSHKVTIGHNLANSITVLNGKPPKIICTMCGY